MKWNVTEGEEISTRLFWVEDIITSLSREIFKSRNTVVLFFIRGTNTKTDNCSEIATKLTPNLEPRKIALKYSCFENVEVYGGKW